MKYCIVAIFDKAAACYHPPHFARAAGAAIREFEDMVSKAESGVVHSHPEHFELYQVGTFDDSNAEFDISVKPFILATGVQCANARAALLQ